MKISNLFFMAMLCVSSATVYAQTAETFRQPYPLGEKLSPNPNFTGEVWLAPLSEQKELNVPMANVTFEPGCRNSWHSHKAGQLLLPPQASVTTRRKDNLPAGYIRATL